MCSASTPGCKKSGPIPKGVLTIVRSFATCCEEGGGLSGCQLLGQLAIAGAHHEPGAPHDEPPKASCLPLCSNRKHDQAHQGPGRFPFSWWSNSWSFLRLATTATSWEGATPSRGGGGAQQKEIKGRLAFEENEDV